MREKIFYKNYIQSEILDADPLKLVCLLYRGALERIAEARRCLRQGDIMGRTSAVTKATLIINELLRSVDRESGGEIAKELVRLYSYVVKRLNEGNFKQSHEPFAEAEQLMRTLSEAWEECHRQTAQSDVEVEYEAVSCAG